MIPKTKAINFSRNQRVERLAIISHEVPEIEIVAHYNPKEIQIDRQVPWHEHPTQAGTHLEFTGGAPGRALTLELVFDCFEKSATANLEAELEELHKLTLPIIKEAESGRLRPPVLEIGNGPMPEGFLCVVDSVSVKVSMFNTFNKPVRATVTLKLKEVHKGDKGKVMVGI